MLIETNNGKQAENINQTIAGNILTHSNMEERRQSSTA